MERSDTAWKEASLSRTFLESVRGAIPFAAEQIAVMLRVVKETMPVVERILDLGCGDGILGRSILASHPKARAVFVDFSDAMLAAAKKLDFDRNTKQVKITKAAPKHQSGKAVFATETKTAIEGIVTISLREVPVFVEAE